MVLAVKTKDHPAEPVSRTSWQPPSDTEISALAAILDPWKRLTSPRFYNLENVPRRGRALLVGNHTMYGLLDVPLMWLEIKEQRDRLVRSLGDHLHFQVPVWRDLLQRFGSVPGTRENCATLLRGGEAVMVFPGGAREVAKRRDEKYRLHWKERMGFARLAIQCGAPIIPFAAVGAEEMYDIVIDAEHPIFAPARMVLERLTGRTDFIWPVSTGLGGTPLPKPERFYFWFGKPIPTKKYAGHHEELQAQRAVRDQARRAIEGGIDFLVRERESDPGRDLSNRLLGRG
jgi:1-acyl-sn-glycerol-3-phosphate acyltransferase